MSQTNDKPTSNTGFGGKLRSARTSRGYSLDAVAGELNILKRHVQAMEEENFDALPQFAFARGFVVNYAKFLELDADEFAREFESIYPESKRTKRVEDIKAPLAPMGTIERGRGGMRFNPWLIAGVIALVIFGFVLLKIISSAVGKSDETNPTTQTQVLSPSEQAQGAAVGASGSALNLGTNDGEPTTQAVTGQGVIDIWSKGDVNIKITDKNDNVLMQGLQSRGGYQLKGETPFTIEIDNPAQVDLNFNQRPIRLGEHTQNGKATLTLQ
ncbi:cytoskeletal protein RodZ [Moraxella lacunata]|uniref:Cytoskeletal protein RodZ n=1 Tax=Moraxella lacunata TaxID=477 RepID=A0A378TS26_MORLA|nr:helix-turn-helix domain-containing protein [Moraxella lacunata]MDO5050395.1 DUF4115 domain-containing protein [Moraxella equi]STZ63655.1 cytoskeletal protein RodZ [Moraxella lacunata]